MGDALVQTVLLMLDQIIAVADAAKSGGPLLSCQGQGMDGHSELANYRDCVENARRVVAQIRKSIGESN